MRIFEYTLPPKCKIETVTIRETDGHVEDEALVAAENNGTTPATELVELSIVAVNGEPVVPGDSGFAGWPSKTRHAVRTLCGRLNDCNMADLAPLIELAEEENTTEVDGRLRTRYPLPPGCSVSAVTLDEMMESDERAAAVAGAKNVTEEMVVRCIASTSAGDGMTREQFKGLNTKTRNIITVYWQGMNFVPESELVPLAKAAEAAQTAAEQGSAASSDGPSYQTGSGSATETAATSPSP